jgi:hypothetical protein
MVLDLLRNIGVTGFTAPENDQALNQPGLDDDDVRRALSAINAGLQTIQKYGPQSLRFGERATYFEAATPIHLSVALNSRAGTASTTPPAWMLGCSILIEGDADLNRIEGITGDDFAFLRGYRGVTNANRLATVYGDAALLDEDIGAVLPPVAGFPNLQLREARSLSEFENYTKRWVPGTEGAAEGTNSRQPGTPAYYYVERRRDGGQLMIRVTPMPAVSFNCTFQAKIRAEHIDEDIVDTAAGVDPGYEFQSLHRDDIDTLLLPIARWHFFTHPALKNAETRQTVKAAYDEVMVNLKNGAAFEVSVSKTRARYK